MPATTDQDQPMTPEEMEAYLKGEDKAGPAAQELDVDPSVVQALHLREAAVKAEAEEIPDVSKQVAENMGAANPQLQSVNKAINQIMGGLAPSTKLTEEEKNAFCDAVLFDQPFSTTVETLNGRVKIKFRTLQVRESTLAYALVRATSKDKDSVQMITIMQQAHVALQLLEFNGGALWTPAFNVTDTGPDGVKALQDYVEKHLSGISEARWALIMECYQIFTARYILATQHAHDPNFWHPAAEG